MNNKVSSTMTEINGTLLASAFKKRGLNQSEIAEQFGYARSYINTCIKRGIIRTGFAELLWNEYNIPLDEYKAHPQDNSETEDTDDNELYKTIRRAVTDAFDDIQGGIFAACYGGMKKALFEYRKENEYGADR